MSIRYSPNLIKIPKTAVLLDIDYLKSPISPLRSKISPTRSLFFDFKKETLYTDLEKATKKYQAFQTLYESSPWKHVIIAVPSILLKQSNDCSFILSGLLRSVFRNVYKTKLDVWITHEGESNKNLYDLIKLLQKVQVARLLSMLPANMATPERLAKRLQGILSKIPNVNTHVYTKNALEKQQMRLLLAVNRGSNQSPSLLTVERKGSPKGPTICIIGKGITFDSGGLALKPIRSMKDMKYDKIGAVSGAMALAYLMEQPSLKHIHFVGVFPFAENVVSENSVKPGDVIKSHSGKTIEIVNPDAEGRLILADALSFANSYKPNLVIDIATLTGHAEYINCWHNGYYFAESNRLKELVEKQSYMIGERMLPMPNWTDLPEMLSSPVADLLNDSSVCDDSVSAALFLREFVPKGSDWLHIDLAHEQTNHIANGNGIRTIVSVVLEMYGKKK